jgi:NAD(P)-dependent dehydrogenase (short-subunit alcohol dehydrogenase family)
MLERHLAVILFGTYDVTHAFLPALTRSQGAIVNNLSLMALAPLPLTPAYAISKAAAFNLTQSLRALLAGRGVRVHAVLTGPTDTDMTRGFDIPKASPQSVAKAIFDGVEAGEEDIFPTPCQGPSPRPGTAARPRHSSARVRRSHGRHSHRQSPSRPSEGKD